MKHLTNRFKHYCCQLWWWDVKDLLKFYEEHYEQEHHRETQRLIELRYCPYCGSEKPEVKHLEPFL